VNQSSSKVCRRRRLTIFGYLIKTTGRILAKAVAPITKFSGCEVVPPPGVEIDTPVVHKPISG